MTNTLSKTKKSSNKVLFITYLFPPAGGVGRFRIVKFLRYLADFGWDPQVLTVKEPNYDLVDKSLVKELPANLSVKKIDYFEPTFWGKNRIWRGLLNYGLYPIFLFPDTKSLWIKNAVREAVEIVKRDRIKVIFSSSFPVSDHIVAYHVKKQTGVKWVADFRDEWATNRYHKFPTPVHRYLAKIWEKRIARAADKIVTVSPLMTDYFSRLTGKPEKCITLTNGFDPEDFRENIAKPKRDFCQIVYAGTLFRQQNLEPFNQAIKELNLPKIQVEFYGGAKRLPHQEIVKVMRQADILFFILSAQEHPLYLTGKLFEYLASRRPILALANPNNAAAKIIQKLDAGIVAHPDKVPEIKKAILELYHQWEKGKLEVPPVDLEPYNRRGITRELAKIFDSLVAISPKKICFIGGRSPQSIKLCRYLVPRRYEIHYINMLDQKILIPGIKDYWIKEKNNYIWEPLKSLVAIINKFKELIKIKKIIRAVEPDIVHGHGLNFSGIMAVYSGFRPVVVTVRGSDVMDIDRMILPEQYLIRQTLKKADLVTGSSEALHKQSLKLGMPEEKFRTVYWGIDAEIFQKRDMSKLREKLKIGKNEIVVFCPRSIKAKYKIGVLLEAVARLKLNYKLIFTDQNLDEAYWSQMQALAKKLKVFDRIIMLPRTDPRGMADLDNLANVIVSIAESDGLPVTFLEAMACEKKMVIADFGFVEEWHKGDNFWVVPVGNALATTKAIETALAVPTSKWAPIGRANRKFVLDRVEINKGFEVLEAVYQELV